MVSTIPDGVSVPVLTRSDALDQLPDGFAILIDKPKGITSFGAIRRLRRVFGIKKVGHAGTLDPMATGLLIVLVGRTATREQDRFMGMPKEYSGTIRLGETTASHDAETPVDETSPTDHLTESDLEMARRKFLGEIEQCPPIYSAIKVGGERLYKKARRGETIAIQARRVTIESFGLTERTGSDVDFLVRCSKGTYIRSLAHDFGEELGVGAHLIALRREAIGPYTVTDAWGVEEIVEYCRLNE